MQVALSEHERDMFAATTWPLHLLEDPRRQPTVMYSAEAFLHELLVGDYVEDVVVLPNGISALGLGESETLPVWLTSALDGASTVLDFLRRLDDVALDAHKAAIEYVDDFGVQREALPRPYPFCLWDNAVMQGSTTGSRDNGSPGVLPESWRNLRQRIAAVEALVAKGEMDPARLYVCEMRRLRERDGNSWNWSASTANYGSCDGGATQKTKSMSLRHVRDCLGATARWTLYWNCYDDGLFVGSRGSGKGLHVDQVLWTNVGKQWRGHKLFVAWPAGETSARMVAEFGDASFVPPLGPEKCAALEQAKKVVLIRPGDVFLFCGGVAHMTLNISQNLTTTAYESMVTLNPRHVAHFLHTGATCGPFALDRGVMEADDLRELRHAVAQRILTLLQGEAGGRTAHGAGRLPRGGALPDTYEELRALLAGAAHILAADAAFVAHAPRDQLLKLADALISDLADPYRKKVSAADGVRIVMRAESSTPANKRRRRGSGGNEIGGFNDTGYCSSHGASIAVDTALGPACPSNSRCNGIYESLVFTSVPSSSSSSSASTSSSTSSSCNSSPARSSSASLESRA